MTDRLDAWERFADMQFWWMHAMVEVWAVFTFILFVAVPLFCHDWFRRRAAVNPENASMPAQPAHWSCFRKHGDYHGCSARRYLVAAQR